MSPSFAASVLHPNISEVWSVFFGQLPNFFDSYQKFSTATEFPQYLPNLPTKTTDFSHRFLRFYLRTAVSCLRTSPPLFPTPRSRPPTRRSCPPPSDRQAPSSSACRRRPPARNDRISPTQLPNFADSYRISPTEIANFANSYRILPTETPNFAYRDTEFCRQLPNFAGYRILPTEKRWETSSPVNRQDVPGLMAAKMHSLNSLRRACRCAWL